MYAIVTMYRRYFRPHRLGLLLTCLCFVAFAAEGSIMAAMSRYLVDEVLQVDLVAKRILRAQPKRFVDPGEVRLQLPERKVVWSGELADVKLPGDRAVDPMLLTDLDADGSLADRVAARPGLSLAEKLHRLAIIAVLLILMHLAAVAAQAWGNVNIGKIAERVTFVLRRHIHDKLLRLQMSYHDQHLTGRLLSRAVDDVQVIENTFANLLTQWAMFIGIIAINVSLMYYINARLATFALLALPFYAYAYGRISGRIKSLSRQQRQANGALYGLIRDRLANPRVIKSFGQEKRELLNFYGRTRDMFRRRRRIVVLNNVLAMVCTCIAGIMTAVTLGLGVILLQRGQMSLGYVLFFYALARGLFYPIAALTQLTAEMQWLTVACERILDVMDEPETITNHPQARTLERFGGSIVFENVNFSYDGIGKQAVEQIDLTIPKGSRICLMGKSGAGKSTIAVLLLRLYDVTEGKISIDGIDLRKIKIASLRKCVSFVPQEPMLFSGTLARNILYGNPHASCEQMIAAAKRAEIHEFIESLPDGYRSIVGENGLRLSGGQKQRLSLARALVTDPDILILDDCTSALDAETEAKIQGTLKTALADKTVVMISHRVSVASNADTVAVLDDGRIVELGSHQELMDRKGHYWNLIKDQLEERTVALASKQAGISAA